MGWQMTHPTTSDIVQGTFGLRLDPIPTVTHGDRYTSLVFGDQSQLTGESVGELDARVALGGHSADVLCIDPAVTGFVVNAQRAARPGVRPDGPDKAPALSAASPHAATT